jgi:hypothetical protein
VLRGVRAWAAQRPGGGCGHLTGRMRALVAEARPGPELRSTVRSPRRHGLGAGLAEPGRIAVLVLAARADHGGVSLLARSAYTLRSHSGDLGVIRDRPDRESRPF